MAAADNVGIIVGVPVAGLTLLPIIVILGAILIAALITDLYLFRNQHLVPFYNRINDTKRFSNGTDTWNSTEQIGDGTSIASIEIVELPSTSATEAMRTFVPNATTEVNPPKQLDNWCGITTKQIDEQKYEVLYDLTLVQPFLQQPHKYRVGLTINFFVWVPEVHLMYKYPYSAIFILPQMRPQLAVLFDFWKFWEGQQRVRLRDVYVPNERSFEAYDIAYDIGNRGQVLHSFNFQRMQNHSLGFKTFRANFSIDLANKRIILQSCINNTDSGNDCRMQMNRTVDSVILNGGLSPAAYVTMALDYARWNINDVSYHPFMRVQLNATQAICCEIYEHHLMAPGVQTKICRVKGTYNYVPCPRDWQDISCGTFKRGY